jgi:hypothetical protein
MKMSSMTLLAILKTLPDPEFFYNLPLTCEDDFFLRV